MIDCQTKLGNRILNYYLNELLPYRHSAVNACLIPLCALDGVAITTIEGIGSTKTKPHPCQVYSMHNI